MEGFFWVWNYFSIPGFLGVHVGNLASFFGVGWLLGIQNKLKICVRGSAHVSRLRNSVNKVQPNLLRLGNSVLDFLDSFFSYSIHQKSKSFCIIIIYFGAVAEYPAHQIPYLKKTTSPVPQDFMFYYVKYLKLSEQNECTPGVAEKSILSRYMYTILSGSTLIRMGEFWLLWPYYLRPSLDYGDWWHWCCESWVLCCLTTEKSLI